MRASLPVLVSLVATSFAVASCGPETPAPVVPPPPVASASASTPPKPPPIVEDRSPVEAPPGLFAELHLAGPKVLTHAIKTYLPNAASLDPREAIRSVIESSALARIVDIDKPVDVAVLLPIDGGGGGWKATVPRAAIAFGVDEAIDAKALEASHRVDVLPGGVLRLVPKAGGSNRCVVAPALGPSMRRLVCAIDPMSGDPMLLAPYLARGVTRKTPSASAMRVDLDVGKLKKFPRYADEIDKAHQQARSAIVPEIKIGRPEIDKVLKKAAQAMVDETFDLLDDVESMSLDVATPAPGIEAAITFAFGTTKSWTAKSMTSGSDVATKPPAHFGKLPGEGAWYASFSRVSPQSDALKMPLQTALLELAEALAIELKWAKKDKDAALEVVRLLFAPSADTVAVTGEVAKSDAPPQEGNSDEKMLKHLMTNKAWTLSAVDREPKAAIDLAKAVGSFLSRPAFSQMIKTFTKDRLSLKVTVKPSGPKDLPKGSFGQSYELTGSYSAPDYSDAAIDPNGKGPKKSKETALGKLLAETLIVADPSQKGRTWIGFGQNLGDGDLWKRLQNGMNGTGPAPLSSRPAFELFTREPGFASGGTLFTLDGLAHTLMRDPKKQNKLLDELPDQGKGVLAARTSSTKQSGELRVLLPRDLVALAFMTMRKW